MFSVLRALVRVLRTSCLSPRSTSRTGTQVVTLAVDDGYFPLAEMKQPVMVAAYEHEVV